MPNGNQNQGSFNLDSLLDGLTLTNTGLEEPESTGVELSAQNFDSFLESLTLNVEEDKEEPLDINELFQTLLALWHIFINV